MEYKQSEVNSRKVFYFFWKPQLFRFAFLMPHSCSGFIRLFCWKFFNWKLGLWFIDHFFFTSKSKLLTSFILIYKRFFSAFLFIFLSGYYFVFFIEIEAQFLHRVTNFNRRKLSSDRLFHCTWGIRKLFLWSSVGFLRFLILFRSSRLIVRLFFNVLDNRCSRGIASCVLSDIRGVGFGHSL